MLRRNREEEYEDEPDDDVGSTDDEDDPIILLVGNAIRRRYSASSVARTILLAIQDYTNIRIDNDSELRDINFILELQQIVDHNPAIEELIKILPIDYSDTILEDTLLSDTSWMNDAISQLIASVNINNSKLVEYDRYSMNVVGVSTVNRDTIIRDRICNNQELNNCGVVILYLSSYSLLTSTSPNNPITEVPDDAVLLEDRDPRGARYQLIPKGVVYNMMKLLLGSINDQSIGTFHYDYADQIIQRTSIRLVINYNIENKIHELGIKIDPIPDG